MIAGFDRNGSRGRGLAVALALLIGCALLTDKRIADAAPADAPSLEKGAEKPLPPAPPVKQPASVLLESRERDEAEDRKDLEADAAAERLLARQLPEVRFDNIGLNDAIDFLRDVSGANIFVNWVALEKAGVARNAPVTTRLKDVKLSRALEHILQNVGGGGIEMGFVVEKGVITISTQNDLDSRTQIKVYDVRDLFAVDEKDEKKAQALHEEMAKEIITLVQETIDPKSWPEKGGKFANIRYLSGQLIVTHTPRHHAQLTRLLDQLRETRAIQINIETRFISTTPDVIRKLKLEPRDGDAPIFMDDEQVNAFLRAAVQEEIGGKVLSAPRLLLMNGQRGEIRIGQEIPYITGFKEVNGRFEPETGSSLKEGTTMNLTATVSEDRKYVTLNAHPRTSKLVRMADAPWPKAPPGRNDLRVHVPRLAVEEYKAVVSVPDGGTLVAVLRPQGEAKNVPDAVTVVLLKPQVVIQGEGEQREFPILPEKP